MRYLRITAIAEDGAAHFKHILNYEDDFELTDGVSLIDEFPDEAEYRMNDDFPDDIQLQDFLHNLDNQIVVNARARAFLESRIDKAEYLSVGVVNHKSRQSEEEYSVVNLLDLEECIDREATQFEEHAMNPDLMVKVRNLTLDESKVPKDRQMFRLNGIPSIVVISDLLAEEMREEGLQGFETSELTKYKG